MFELFTTFIYQPFFNIIVFIYWTLQQLSPDHADMGVAVILLALVVRILLLPLSLSGEKSESERREIAKKISEAEEEHRHDPVMERAEKTRIMRSNRGVVIGELFSLGIQVAISLMLWRMFETGLTGQDLHLLYPFMPEVSVPYNLNFLGMFDLTHTSWRLNLFQSFLIFLLETLSINTSPYPPKPGEVVRMQLVLPLVAFLIFIRLPAGKKLFVITTLLFSICLTLFKYTKRKFNDYKVKFEAKQASLEEEKVVVEQK